MNIAERQVVFAALCAIIGCVSGSAFAQNAPSGEPAPPGAVGNLGSVTKPPVPDPVVAEVGDQQIHLSELADEIRSLPGGNGENAFAALYTVALNRLIEREVLVIRAREDGLADKADVLRHMQEASDQALEDAYLHQATAARVTEPMLLQRYQQDIAGKPGPEEVHGWAILLPTESEATEIIAKIQSGGDFAGLARQFSKDASAAKGGDLGFVARDALSPQVGAVLFDLRPGAVTPYPVKTDAGWFVLRAEARRTSPTPSFAQSHARLEADCQRDEIGTVVQAAVRQVAVQSYDVPPNGPPASGGGGNSGGTVGRR